MTLGVLGPRGTFSHEAANKLGDPKLVFCRDIQEVFELVERDEVEMGLVPIENSIEGSIGMTMELLQKKDLLISGEIIQDIEHNLLALPGIKLEDIKEVTSIPIALAQCKSFLSKLNIRTRNLPSTADAAREIKEKMLETTAAIATWEAAKIYGLEILAKGIQDESHNQTRFIIISKKKTETTGKDKTSVIIALKDKPGALYEILGIFARDNINLTKIESRPSRKALGDYYFYIDFEGHVNDSKINSIIENLKSKVAFLKVLGSYPNYESHSEILE